MDLKELLQKSLQIKRTLLLDAYQGLEKMAHKLWKALESQKSLFFLGEDTSHTLAHFVAEEIRSLVTPLAPKIYCPLPPQILPQKEIHTWLLSFLKAHLEPGDFLILFAQSGSASYLQEVARYTHDRQAFLLLIAAQGHKIPKDWIHWGLAVPTLRQEEVWEIHLIVGNFFLTYFRHRLEKKKKKEIPSEKKREEKIRFLCPYCKGVIYTDARFAGKEGVCPSCEKVLLVPSHSTLSPKERQGEEKRLHIRFRVQDCLVTFAPDKYPESVSELVPHGILDDLSEGGCAFLIDSQEMDPSPLVTGKKIFLLIDVPAFNKPLRFQGEVKRKEKLKDKKIKVAVQFTKMSQENRQRLKKLASSDILRNLRRGKGFF